MAGSSSPAPTGSSAFSPELFFTLEAGRITARPMKGTAPRDADPARFAADPKQRAENLMIVDLLRNDLSRVASTRQRRGAGPVRGRDLSDRPADDLDRHRRRSSDGLGPVDVLEAIFPCGSITGAPKIRAMEIIAGLEAAPRGAYSGAIGRLAPDGDAAFNVAIRTLVLKAGERMARLGLGSGDRRGQRGRRRMARMPGEGNVCGDGPELRPHRDDALRSRTRASPISTAISRG